MKITRVDIENFMAISQAHVALADRGLVLVQGDNADETSADSNGAGKSSFADAICWALYGVTARGEEGDRVVNRFVGKDCYVKVTVIDESHQYEITRYRKHKKFKNVLRVNMIDAGATETDLTKGTEKLTQMVVDQILGASYEVFAGAVYAGQERMPDLPGMPDKQLKMLIEEASGATLLEAAYEEAKRRLNVKRAECDAARNILDRARFELHASNDRLDVATRGRDEFETNRLSRVKDLVQAAKDTKAAIAELEVKIKAHDGRASVEDQIKRLDEAIASVDGENEKLTKLNEEISAEQRHRAEAVGAVPLYQNRIKQEKTKLDLVAHEVGCPCKSCGRTMTEAELAPRKLSIQTMIDADGRDIELLNKTIGDSDNRIKTLADKRDAFKASMTDLSAVNAQRTTLTKTLRDIEILESGVIGHKSDFGSLVNMIKAKGKEENPFLKQIKNAEEEIKKYQETVDDLAIQLKDREKELAVQEAVAKVFSPAGVRAFLLDEVTPFLNDQTAKYLGTLSDGSIQATWTTLIKTAKGELREKFSIEVTSVHGGETFKGISGGEKRKVRIACALALQDLVARRATKPIELFIGDEIDDALDPAGLERLTMILEEKAKERGSVFIISHSDLKDWIRNVITVRKVGGKATIEEMVS